ncbi:G5 domain-containing protein [Candidatus Nanosynbacter sp. TM7-074]|uniref:G5 domain-containing protein n=1 Tax=Candidatus Nanosynbacter sp. TM7-074 TaxID=3158573 RepID=A0AB39JB06_9BACT
MRAKGLFFGKIIGFAMSIMIAMPMSSFAEGKSPSRHLVRVYDRGEEKTIVTNALTVRQALQSAKISIDEKMDTVEPNIDMELTGSKYQVNIFRARPITIVDGNKRLKITTAEQTPALIAKAAGMTLYREDKTQFTNSENLLVNGAGLVMKIERAKQRTVTEEADINFQIEQVKDDSQPIGFKSVRQLGEKGVRKITYRVEVDSEREVSRREMSSEIMRQPKKQVEIIGTKPKNPLTKSKGAQIFTDSKGVAHRETYYDLPMNMVIKSCGAGGGYTVRADGAKVDKDGYILVAANYGNYPRCSVVETSMGLGKVYDTGGFAARYPHGFDLATDWTNGDGR